MLLASDPVIDTLLSNLKNPVVLASSLALAAVVILYAAVRVWLIFTRPSSAHGIPTPTIDRMNTNALESMTSHTAEEHQAHLEESHSAPLPEDLLAAIPEEETPPEPPPLPEPPRKEE